MTTFARHAKGVFEHRVIARHRANALIPAVTITLTPRPLGGGRPRPSSLDGMGYYFIQRFGQLDLYAVMGYLV